MKRKVLINEIISFCFDYDLFKKPVKARALKNNINKKLQDAPFVESLINTIFIKAKYHKTLKTKKVMDLLLELEKTRLELEDRNSNKIIYEDE